MGLLKAGMFELKQISSGLNQGLRYTSRLYSKYNDDLLEELQYNKLPWFWTYKKETHKKTFSI